MKGNCNELVRVVHGANRDRLPIVGRTIATVKRSLRDVFNIPYFAEARVDGVPVDADHVLGECGVVEFGKSFGSKGGNDEIPSETEARGILTAYEEDLRQIGEQVRAANLNSEDSIDMVIGLVDRWCQRKFGPILAMEVAEVMKTVKHLGQLMQVAAVCQGCKVVGRPGRKNTTQDIALFAHVRRTSENWNTWKEIYTAWKRQHPDDERVKKWDHIREAHRRQYRDKSKEGA